MEKEFTEVIISQDEWVKLINAGCRSSNKAVAYKYLEYVGSKYGYENSHVVDNKIQFSEEIEEYSDDEWQEVVKTVEARDKTFT